MCNHLTPEIGTQMLGMEVAAIVTGPSFVMMSKSTRSDLNLPTSFELPDIPANV